VRTMHILYLKPQLKSRDTRTEGSRMIEHGTVKTEAELEEAPPGDLGTVIQRPATCVSCTMYQNAYLLG
jgi:hypothetical protein